MGITAFLMREFYRLKLHTKQIKLGPMLGP
jgi:hypothetical protein